MQYLLNIWRNPWLFIGQLIIVVLVVLICLFITSFVVSCFEKPEPPTIYPLF